MVFVCHLFKGNHISSAKIALGAVAPTVRRANITEGFLIGKELTREVIKEASSISAKEINPIDDVRASKAYRCHLVPILIEKGLNEISNGKWGIYEENPVLLWGKEYNGIKAIKNRIAHSKNDEILTKINGQEYHFVKGQDKTLLELVRDQARLTGTKLGCGEGECGACTLYLNGLPVLSCLVPAPRAHEAEITTIEGLAKNTELHPVQKAFIEEGAVQCGYCTPGFIMSAVKLLDEKPNPTKKEIKEGLVGNICRCTGYYSIISAVERSSQSFSSQ